MANGFNTLPANIPEEALAEFNQPLRLSPIGPKTWWNQDTTGKFDVSREWLTEAKETWLSTKFNWRTHEDYINSFPNFKIPIIEPEAGTVGIHFAALFSKKVNAIPIRFLHGYPGSFMEFLPMLETLADRYTAETLPYHVIVPSLPDYALSGGASENVEMTLDRAARIMNQLMLDLGFASGYVAQGGDLGSILVRIMAVQYDACKSFHVNMLVLNPDQKLNRTITDVYQDKLYNPAQAQRVSKEPRHQQQNLLAPSYQNPLNDRLKAANHGHLSTRNQSHMGSIHRDRSPFRQYSPLAAKFDQHAFRRPGRHQEINMGRRWQGIGTRACALICCLDLPTSALSSYPRTLLRIWWNAVARSANLSATPARAAGFNTRSIKPFLPQTFKLAFGAELLTPQSQPQAAT